MPKTVFVAGATSLLGRHLIQRLKERGDRVHALTRTDAGRAVLEGLANEVYLGDALQDNLSLEMDGADMVFSCVGNTVRPDWKADRRAYTAFDTPANLKLIEAAKAAKVGRFVYVSVIAAPDLRELDYLGAHAKVEDALKASGLSYGIVRPTGFFSAFNDLVRFAQWGIVPVIGDGHWETNPIHEADLAAACVDALEGGPEERDVGGPEILTRRRIAEMACMAAGRKPRVLPVPAAFARMGARLIARRNPRLSHLINFAATIFTRTAVAPRLGARKIADHFNLVARGG